MRLKSNRVIGILFFVAVIMLFTISLLLYAREYNTQLQSWVYAHETSILTN